MHQRDTDRSPVGDFLERWARDRGGDLINDDGTVNSAKLGARLDVSQAAIYRLITGETRHPKYETIRHIAARTGVAEAVILGDHPPPDVNQHTLDIARKLEQLPSGERAMIEAMADKFLELIRAAEDIPKMDDTGRFRTIAVDDARSTPRTTKKRKVRK